MTYPPPLTQFRVEITANGVAHLVFDCPGRTMNVFSEAAIADLGAFAAWLPEAPVHGAVIRSGKANAFCAGADLTELSVAYDMITAAPPRRRFNLAYDHFFRLSSACRALETAGKPVAAAIAGLALGGGCELALAAHHRVLVDAPNAALGLPESLVGLLPGAGGTQRLPRLIGVEAAMPILLEGARLAGHAALDAGLVQRLVLPGEEIAAAEAWVLGAGSAVQPWDCETWAFPPVTEVASAVAPIRERVLAQTLGHYPAPLAILDCVQHGLPQTFEGAIRTEMSLFAELIQRAEPRDMIATLFLAKTEHDRLKRAGQLPDFITEAVIVAMEAVEAEDVAVLARAGLGGAGGPPVRTRASAGYWLDSDAGAEARKALERVGERLTRSFGDTAPGTARMIDYAVVADGAFPAYLGGPLAFTARSSAKV